MKRGELYRVYKGNRNDSKNFRVFVIVSRQTLIESNFSSVICAPIYSRFDGLSTQMEVGTSQGLKKSSSIFCDALVSVEKSRLTNYVGLLSDSDLIQLNRCLRIALQLDR